MLNFRAMSREEFESTYPTLRYGLLSITALLDLCDVQREERLRIKGQKRPTAVPLKHPRAWEFLINDQTPMTRLGFPNA